MRVNKDLVAASSAPLVLGILEDGESYGYAILKRVEDLSDGQLEWTDGMLYPLLHRLERLGHVTSSWQRPEGGRRRKYYRLTPAGAAALADHRRQWSVVSGTLNAMWGQLQISLARVVAQP